MNLLLPDSPIEELLALDDAALFAALVEAGNPEAVARIAIRGWRGRLPEEPRVR